MFRWVRRSDGHTSCVGQTAPRRGRNRGGRRLLHHPRDGCQGAARGALAGPLKESAEPIVLRRAQCNGRESVSCLGKRSAQAPRIQPEARRSACNGCACIACGGRHGPMCGRLKIRTRFAERARWGSGETPPKKLQHAMLVGFKTRPRRGRRQGICLSHCVVERAAGMSTPRVWGSTERRRRAEFTSEPDFLETHAARVPRSTYSANTTDTTSVPEGPWGLCRPLGRW